MQPWRQVQNTCKRVTILRRNRLEFYSCNNVATLWTRLRQTITMPSHESVAVSIVLSLVVSGGAICPNNVLVYLMVHCRETIPVCWVSTLRYIAHVMTRPLILSPINTTYEPPNSNKLSDFPSPPLPFPIWTISRFELIVFGSVIRRNTVVL